MKLVKKAGLTFILALVTLCSFGKADKVETDSTSYKAYLGGYPIVFFLPETSWSFGAGGVYNFYTKKEAGLNPSQILLGGAYTLNKQILSFASYQLFFKQNDVTVFGELGYYEYFYPYFGIGDRTIFTDEENYSVDFPRIQINYLQRVYKNLSVGALFHFDDYLIRDIEPGGLLATVQPDGFTGSRVSRIGLLARIDSRDQVFYPSGGHFATLQLAHHGSFIGSSETFTSISLDATTYKKLKKGILAVNLWTGQSFGDIPFQELFQLGGGKKARGIIQGRFRDRSVALLQAEYRFNIWKRFAGALFTSYGSVSESLPQIFNSQWKLNYGAGIRFFMDPVNKTSLRADVAFGSDEFNFYFTVSEAF